MAYNTYPWMPGVGTQPIAGLGSMPEDRLQTSQSGVSYIGGMAPTLPTQDMSFMWGGNGSMAPNSPSGSGVSAGFGELMSKLPSSWMNTQRESQTAQYQNPDGSYKPGYEWMAMAGGPTGGQQSGSATGVPGMSTGVPTQSMGWNQSARGGTVPGITSTPSAFGGGSYGNPNQSGMDDAITRQFTDTLMNQWLPGIQSQAVGSGSLGGSRQGVAQGGAIGQAGQGLASALAQSHYGQYNQDANRDLQRYGMDQNFYLGNQGQNQGFYTAQRGLDQSGAQLGANLYNLGQQGQWTPFTQYTSTLAPWSGNGTTTTSGSQGGGWQSGIGGALSGAALAHQLGWI